MKVCRTVASLEIVAIDIISELVTTTCKHKYLLVISDHCFNIVRTVRIWTNTAKALAKAFATH